MATVSSIRWDVSLESLFRGKDLKNLPSEQVQKLNAVFSRILSQPAFQAQLKGMKEFQFDFDLKPDGLCFRLAGQHTWTVVATESEFPEVFQELQKAKRLIKDTEESEQAIRELDEASCLTKTARANGVFLDGVFFTNNSLAFTQILLQIIGTASAALDFILLPVIPIVRGPLALIQGTWLAARSAPDIAKAYRTGDWDEGLNHTLAAIGGGMYGVFGAGLTTWASGQIAALAGANLAASGTAMAAGTLASTLGAPVMFGALGAYAAINLVKTTDFGDDLQEILGQDNDRLSNLTAALDWINNQLAISDEEAALIKEKTKNNPTEEATLRANLIEKKQAQFERKTGESCLKLVKAKLPGIFDLQKSANPAEVSRFIPEAEELVHQVEKANYKEQVKHKLLLLVCILGLIAGVVVLFSPLSPFAAMLEPLIFVISAVVWVFIDSPKYSEKISERFWQRHFAKQRAVAQQRALAL
jgi:hypothetical protein